MSRLDYYILGLIVGGITDLVGGGVGGIFLVLSSVAVAAEIGWRRKRGE